MENLQLIHLTGYLPHKLKAHCSGLHIDEYADTPEPIQVEIVGANTHQVEVWQPGRSITETYDFQDVFPILRPFSDLDSKKLGEVKEEMGATHEQVLSLFDFLAEEIDILDLSTGLVQLLYKHHFDVHRLIPNKLAININTLK